MKSRTKRLHVALGVPGALIMGLGAALIVLWSVSGVVSARAAPASELHVCPSECAYASIQAAVDAAEAGDVIKVAEGTYTDIHTRGGITQVVYISKTITLRGGYSTTDWSNSDPTAHPTTLDARKEGRVVTIIGEGISPTVEGLRITGGVSPEPLIIGGGLYVEDAGGLIRGNVIYSNTASYYGAGAYLHWSSVRLVNNAFMSNTASLQLGGGGGVYVSYGTPTLEGCLIQDNSALSGGGVHLSRGSATVTGSTIRRNLGVDGGGLYLYAGSPTLTGNLISDNAAGRGSGLEAYGGEPTLINNVILNNTATLHGGIFVSAGSAPHMMHTTIVGNTGGDGSGICVSDRFGGHSSLTMTNTVLSGHTVGIMVTAGNTATLEATLWHANGTNTGGMGTVGIGPTNVTGDPAFAPDGYHLMCRSEAINAGVYAGVETDIDGDVRPQGVGYDIGADEFVQRVYLPLVIRNQ